MSFEIYVAPAHGPCIVHQRGPDGEVACTDEARAIAAANAVKRKYPHMDFVVLGQDTHNGPRHRVYRT